MRTGKTATFGTSINHYAYVYEGGQLLQMTRNNYVYDFSYDANGTPISIAYRTRATATPTYYYYAVNSRGDITALYNGSGSIVAVYEYDAYGKLISVENATGVAITSATHIANMNPLRYRGYVYDTETGFYYLQSRYYDPTTCRFINEDIYYDTGRGFNGYNMFAYCNNNPIMSYDPNGKDAILLFDDNFVGHIGALVEDENGDWWHFYWGTSGGKTSLSVFCVGVEATTWFVPYEGKLSIRAINQSNQYGGEYKYGQYLKADFSSCIDSFTNIDKKYNLLTNNCSKVTTKILASAETPHAPYLEMAASNVVPSAAFWCVTLYEPTFEFSISYQKITLKERLFH